MYLLYYSIYLGKVCRAQWFGFAYLNYIKTKRLSKNNNCWDLGWEFVSNEMQKIDHIFMKITTNITQHFTLIHFVRKNQNHF